MSFAAALSLKLDQQAERIDHARAEFNYAAIAPHIPDGCAVLDVGAWRCYLGRLLRNRKNCRMTSVDVVDANHTELPLQLFDGATLPLEARSQDVVLLQYVLHHAGNDAALLREVHRVLRDGGTLLVAEDLVDGFWNSALTHGFHLWLRGVTGMARDGQFRRVAEWEQRFQFVGFRVQTIVHLGHHLGRALWPRNVLFVLLK